MPDYNADREGHRKYKYLVHDATREHLESVPTSKGDLKFNRDGRLVVNDPALANEIRTSTLGKRAVCVSRVNGDSPADRGHKYFFGRQPGLPWLRYDEFGRRLPDEVSNGSLQTDQDVGDRGQRDSGADAQRPLSDGDV